MCEATEIPQSCNITYINWRCICPERKHLHTRCCKPDIQIVSLSNITPENDRVLMFVDQWIIVWFIQKNPTRCNNVSKFYYSTFIWSSTCFEQHTAHHHEPKTALAASGFSYIKSCWTLSGTVLCLTSTNYTSNNLPRMKNQRLPVQF
jgi:hypothetical protein